MEQVSVLETNIGASTSGNSANTQIIFNDNGTLRGDAGLVYNKTTDTLTAGSAVVTGAATITGDLTVHTSTLKVDSTNHRVGIGTASPTSGIKLDIVSTTSDNFVRFTDSVNATGYLGVRAANGAVYLHGNSNIVSLSCSTSNTTATEQLRITNPGVFEFLDGAGGTRMTLNSTGLGIGASPATDSRITIGSTNATGFQYALRTTGITTGRTQIYLTNTSGDFIAGVESTPVGPAISGATANCGYAGTSTSNPFYLVTNSVVRATLDTSGNVGIGVTPNTWTIGKHILIGGTAGVFHYGANGQAITGINAYYNSGWKYAANGAASNYEQSNGSHVWYNAPVGIAGNTATFTQAMTLNPTGNLVFPTGKGIDFSAVTGGTGTATANVLNDYEEGTWTPTDGSGAGLAFTVSNCRYTKVGRAVTVQGTVAYPVTANGSNALWLGFPFTAADIIFLSVAYTDASIASFTYLSGVNNAAYLLTPGVNTINSTLSGKSISFFGTYMV